YIETSALDTTNVEQAFRSLIADIYRNWVSRIDLPEGSHTIDPPIRRNYAPLSKLITDKPSGYCCPIS
ncbi:unnamed protein product, partial [Rotaria sordida]